MHSLRNDEWVATLTQHGTPAQAELYTALGNCLHGILCWYIGQRSRTLPGLAPLAKNEQAELAHDCVQQALIAIHDNLTAYRGEGAFLNWAKAIAIRKASEELRRAHWQTVRYDPVANPLDDACAHLPLFGLPPLEPDSASAVLAAEAWSLIDDAIKTDLSEKQRTAFLARFVEGRSNDEIAAAAGVTPSVIYQRIHQARLKIKQRLLAAGYEHWELE